MKMQMCFLVQPQTLIISTSTKSQFLFWMQLQVAAENSVAVHMYEKCGYAVISRTADHPWHWVFRYVLKAFLGYPDWNMMAKQLMTSQGSKSTKFTPVRIPISANAASAAKPLPSIPESPVEQSIKAANADGSDADHKPRLKPRAVFSFTASAASSHTPASWVMDVGDDDGEEDRLLEEASAAGQRAEIAAMSGGAKRSASQVLPTITELLSEDESDDVLENGSAMLRRKSGLTRLPSFKLSNLIIATGTKSQGRRRPLTRTATM